MFTDVQIINLGLAKIASSQISRIDPPQTSLERFVSAGYEHWKRSELAKHKWVFAREDEYPLAKVQDNNSTVPLTRRDGRNFKYQLPVHCLRPIRTKRTEWVQRGRFLFSCQDNLRIEYLRNADETEFDPAFVEVLASRISVETVEYVTQSNTKKADVKTLYDQALAEAKNLNAFTVGPEDVTSDDNDFPFITSRYNPHG